MINVQGYNFILGEQLLQKFAQETFSGIRQTLQYEETLAVLIGRNQINNYKGDVLLMLDQYNDVLTVAELQKILGIGRNICAEEQMKAEATSRLMQLVNQNCASGIIKSVIDIRPRIILSEPIPDEGWVRIYYFFTEWIYLSY